MKPVKDYLLNLFPILSRKVFYAFNKFLYKGNNFFCPICDQGYKKFLPGPYNRDINAKCPGCGSLERHRLLWLYLSKKIKIKEQKISLLNIAPDYAIQNKLRELSNINYFSIDLNSPLAMRKADLTNLPFDENTFDAVLCYHVLEHIEDDRKAISEIYRVLKPGGWSILQTPFDKKLKTTIEDISVKSPEDRKKIYGQEDHVGIYGLDYINRLESTGFKVN